MQWNVLQKYKSWKNFLRKWQWAWLNPYSLYQKIEIKSVAEAIVKEISIVEIAKEFLGE